MGWRLGVSLGLSMCERLEDSRAGPAAGRKPLLVFPENVGVVAPSAAEPVGGLTVDPVPPRPEDLGRCEVPPELWWGEWAEGRSEVYAVASIVWTACFGRPPFEGPPAVRVAAMLAEEPGRTPEVPPALVGILTHALSCEPGARLRSLQALYDELAALVTATELAEARGTLHALGRRLEERSVPSPPPPSPASDDDDEAPASTVFWVALSTAALVASALLWWALLAGGRA